MAAEPHILVIDDDDRLRDLLKAFLTRVGYRVSVAADAAAAEHLMGSLTFDLLVCDVMMPGEDGMAFTKRLRQTQTVPVLLLTARGLPSDRIEGLRAGADDYLPKPFEPEELALRVAAILRRGNAIAKADTLNLGSSVFDTQRSELKRDGAVVRLAPAEAALLKRLAQTPHQPVERYQLAKLLGEGGDRAVDVQITRLRKKIEDDPRAPSYVQTVRGIGYMLVPHV